MTTQMALPKHMPRLSGLSGESIPDTESLVNRLYQLTYFRGGSGQLITFLLFSKEINIGQAVILAKEYCKHNELRFMFLVPAIQRIDVQEIVE